MGSKAVVNPKGRQQAHEDFWPIQAPGQGLEYEFEQTPYESIVVDITNRCNLNCGLCYLGPREPKDLPLETFRDFCARLPQAVTLKLAGGEPTLHPQLPAMIKMAYRHGHRIYLQSNGLRYLNSHVMGSLRDLAHSGVHFTLGMSMDGGTANAEAYRVINGGDLLEKKLAAFEVLADSHIGRICISAIIVRGLNEDVIGQVIELGMKRPDAVRYIHLRNACNVGTRFPSQPYTMEELRDLVRVHFTPEQFEQQCVAEVHCPPESNRGCCYRFRPTPRLQISLVEFLSARALNCPQRGRLSLGTTRVQQLFWSILQDLPPRPALDGQAL
jgi:molybdenum cofactor biosynthesis enzyme MoaA